MIELVSIASVPNFSLYLETGQVPTEFSMTVIAASATSCGLVKALHEQHHGKPA
jgi:hypothetical protein